MIKKSLISVGLILSASSVFSAEYHGYVRGVNIHQNGEVQVFMSSHSQTATQCSGPFDTTAFKFTMDNTNTHIVSNWLPLLEASRQAKFAQEGVTSLPHPATDPATVKIGYTVEVGGACTIDYVYNLNWFDL